MLYSFIKNNEQLFPIKKMCKVLQVSNGSYYRWKRHRITARLQRKIAIEKQITVIYFESQQRYGSPGITLQLQSLGYKISRPESFARIGEAITVTNTVTKYMKQLGLRTN